MYTKEQLLEAIELAQSIQYYDLDKEYATFDWTAEEIIDKLDSSSKSDMKTVLTLHTVLGSVVTIQAPIDKQDAFLGEGSSITYKAIAESLNKAAEAMESAPHTFVYQDKSQIS